MMTVAAWRKRAHDCMAAARLAPDEDGQLGWQRLSNTWLMCAEWADREKLSGKSTEMRVVGPVGKAADPARSSAFQSGELLRSRLAL